MLERSFHVATLDYDKDLIEEAPVAFAAEGHRLSEAGWRPNGWRRSAERCLPSTACPIGSPATTSRTSPGSPASR